MNTLVQKYSLFLLVFILIGCTPDSMYIEEYWDSEKKQLRVKGKTIVSEYENDVPFYVKHGVWKRWHINGELEYRATFDMGKTVGQEVYYHTNGIRRMVIPYTSSGVMDGEKKWFDYDGKEVFSTKFSNGDGIDYLMSDDGARKIMEVPLNNGYMHGEAIHYDDSMNVISNSFYIDGKPVSPDEYMRINN